MMCVARLTGRMTRAFSASSYRSGRAAVVVEKRAPIREWWLLHAVFFTEIDFLKKLFAPEKIFTWCSNHHTKRQRFVHFVN